MKKKSFAKKFAVSAMAVLMAATLLTGCGGDSNEGSSGEEFVIGGHRTYNRLSSYFMARMLKTERSWRLKK